MDHKTITQLEATVNHLNTSPMPREHEDYIKLMVDIVQFAYMLCEGDLLSVDLQHIEDVSGNQVFLRTKLTPKKIPVDVLYMIELPNFIRTAITEQYISLETKLGQNPKHSSMEHKRIFQELKTVQATKTYHGILKTDLHSQITYCIRDLSRDARFLQSRRLMNDKLSKGERAARQAEQLTHLMIKPARALFRLLYLSQNPQVWEQIKIEGKADFLKGTVKAVEYGLEQYIKWVQKEVEKSQDLLIETTGATATKTSYRFPGNFLITEVDDHHLESVREMAKHWDQLKYATIDQIKNGYSVSKLKEDLTLAYQAYENDSNTGQAFFVEACRTIAKIKPWIEQSNNPNGWVQQSLKLDYKLKKRTEEEHKDDLAWVSDNTASLVALASEAYNQIVEVVKRKHAIPNVAIKNLIVAFNQGQLIPHEEYAEMVTSKYGEKDYPPLFNEVEDLADEDEEIKNRLSKLLDLHQQVEEKCNDLELIDTSLYGTLMIAFPNFEEREEEIRHKLLPKFRKYKALDDRLRNLILKEYKALGHQAPNISILSVLDHDAFEHFIQVIEEAMITHILADDYSLIDANNLKIRFLKIKFMTSSEEKDRHLLLLRRILQVIPPAIKLTKFRESRPEFEKTKFDFDDNQNNLRLLMDELDSLHVEVSKDEEAVFNRLGLLDFWWGRISKDLDLLKATFVDVVALNEDEPLSHSYRNLKERIHQGFIHCRRGRSLLYETHRSWLTEKGIEKEAFYQILQDNIDRLRRCMDNANQALISLKRYHRELGLDEDFSYLELAMDEKTLEEAYDQYHFREEMPYEALQRFAGLHTTRSRQIIELMRTALQDGHRLPEELKECLSRPVIERYMSKKKISSSVLINLLNQDTLLNVEVRYLAYLTNYAKDNEYEKLMPIKRLTKLYNELTSFDNPIGYKKTLKKIYGNLHGHLHAKYKPSLLEANFQLNRKRLLRLIFENGGNTLDITHEGAAFG